MILLTLLNDNKIVVNAELIKTIETTPDTVISFVNGEKLIVKEKVEDVVEKVITYKRLVNSLIWLG